MRSSTPHGAHRARRLDSRLRPSVKLLPEQTRAHNRALVLQQLFRSGTSSRASVARSTGLTRVTVSDLVSELIDEGFVEDLGIIDEQRVGKPATRIGMRTEAFQVVSIDLADGPEIRGAVMTLSGAIIARQSVAAQGRTGADAIDLVERLCRSLVAEATQPVLGVGVGCPGVITSEGVVTSNPSRQWQDVALAAVLDQRLGLPVHVDNDANVATLGEFTFGGTDETGLLILLLRQGVGAGIMVDGSLISGSGSAAGEIGHVTVVEEGGVLCRCGRTGCLETLVSQDALHDAIDEASVASRPDVLARSGELVGGVLAPVVSALNLEQVILSGDPALVDGALRERALATLQRHTMPAVAEQVSVQTTSLGADIVLAGGAALVLSARLGIS